MPGVRMKELSERSGVPVASIKYYLREGLLAAGHATGATQAVYDAHHLDRLRLIRILREVGDLPIARIAAVLRAVEDEDLPLGDLLATAHHALGPEPSPATSDGARTAVLAHLRAKGWNVSEQAPSLDVLAAALDAVRAEWSSPEVGPDVFDLYLEPAFTIAEQELASVEPGFGRSATVQQVIVGTVVFEQALVALRRLAQEHHSRRRFGPADPR